MSFRGDRAIVSGKPPSWAPAFRAFFALTPPLSAVAKLLSPFVSVHRAPPSRRAWSSVRHRALSRLSSPPPSQLTLIPPVTTPFLAYHPFSQVPFPPAEPPRITYPIAPDHSRGIAVPAISIVLDRSPRSPPLHPGGTAPFLVSLLTIVATERKMAVLTAVFLSYPTNIPLKVPGKYHAPLISSPVNVPAPQIPSTHASFYCIPCLRIWQETMTDPSIFSTRAASAPPVPAPMPS